MSFPTAGLGGVLPLSEQQGFTPLVSPNEIAKAVGASGKDEPEPMVLMAAPPTHKGMPLVARKKGQKERVMQLACGAAGFGTVLLLLVLLVTWAVRSTIALFGGSAPPHVEDTTSAPPPTTQVATTSAGPRAPQAPKEKHLKTALKIGNMDYARIDGDSKLKAKLLQKLKESLAAKMHVKPEDIKLATLPGSVRVVVDIKGPQDEAGIKAAEEEIDAGTDLADAVTHSLGSDPDISQAATGPIRVDRTEKAAVVEEPAHSAHLGDTELRLRLSRDPTKCLDIRGLVAGGPEHPKLEDCGTPELSILVGPDGTMRPKAFPGMCLNTFGGAELRLWSCTTSSSANIEFEVPTDGFGQVHLRSDPTKCLVPMGGDSAVPVTLAACNPFHAIEASWTIEADSCRFEGWSEWTDCDVSCGHGKRTRAAIPSEDPRCTDSLEQTAPCAQPKCGAEDVGAAVGATPPPPEPPPSQAGLLRLAGRPTFCLVAMTNQKLVMQECSKDHGVWQMSHGDSGTLRWSSMPEHCLSAGSDAQLRMVPCKGSSPDQIQFTLSSLSTPGSHSRICLAAEAKRCLVAPGAAERVPVRFAQPGGGFELRECGPLGSDVTCAQFQATPVGCDFMDWAAWSSCSATCGSGMRSRKRYRSPEDKICPDSFVEEAQAVCTLAKCPSTR